MGKKSKKKKSVSSSVFKPKEKMSGYSKHVYYVGLIITVLFTILIRLRLLGIPLERDEGEYAYAGQLILQGIPPYAEIYNMKLPGIYAAFALIEALFGQSISGIHIGLLVVNVLAVIIIFFLASRFFTSMVGVSAAAVYAVLSAGQYVHGVFAHAEHFVVLFALLGIFLLDKAVTDRQKIFLSLSGVSLGIAILMKQHGAAFAGFAVSYLLFKNIRRRPNSWKNMFLDISLFISGLVLPLGLTCLIFFLLGIFDRFWFWIFTYAQQYISILTWKEGLSMFTRTFVPILKSAPFLWLLSAIGLFAGIWDGFIREKFPIIGFFLFFSLLSIMPGLWFREHYFILILPVISLLAGVAIFALGNLMFKISPSLKNEGAVVILLILALCHSLYLQKDFLFEANSVKASRRVYGIHHPFPESVEVADFIGKNTLPNDRVLILGSEPQVLFYAKRRSATGYIYMYPFTEKQPFAAAMKEQMIKEIELNRPKAIVYFKMSASWVATLSANEKNLHEMIERVQKYVQNNYDLIGFADVLSDTRTEYSWHKDTISVQTPTTRNWIGIYKRRTT